MLTDGERAYLEQALTATLSRLGDARSTLSTVLPIACMTRIRYCSYPGEYALEAIRVCVEARWDAAPPWTVELLNLLPETAEVVAIRTRLGTPPSEPDPHLAHVLATELPFVDRARLRQKQAALRQERAARPVLVVNGARKSGKSYTFEYIRHLHLNGLPFEYCRVAMARGNGLTWGPEQVAAAILTNIGVDVSSLGPSFSESDTNKERWPYELAGRVLVEGKKVGKRHWIVLDNFTGPELREDTQKFIVALVERIGESAAHSETYRLILLGFDLEALVNCRNHVDVETIAAFGDSDVVACIEEIFRRQGQAPSAHGLKPVTDRILGGLPTDHTRMKELNDRLTDLIEELR